MRAARVQSVLLSAPPRQPHFCISRRAFANIRNHESLLTFTPSIPYEQAPSGFPQHENGDEPPDERTIKLGKTLQILQPALPTLLASPLPQEILSPHISLHLFPSTHPHLPTVSGRVAYHAALWTSPITWGKIPLVGNVQLDILSERMVKPPGQSFSSAYHDRNHNTNHSRAKRNRSSVAGTEKLIVRWRTSGKTKGLGVGGGYKGISAGQSVDRITAWLGGDEKRDDREFCGKFIFEFDEEGRIWDHVIERAEEGSDSSSMMAWEMGVGGRVVGLTDWLLGRLGRGSNGQHGHGHGEPSIAMLTSEDNGRREERR